MLKRLRFLISLLICSIAVSHSVQAIPISQLELLQTRVLYRKSQKTVWCARNNNNIEAGLLSRSGDNFISFRSRIISLRKKGHLVAAKALIELNRIALKECKLLFKGNGNGGTPTPNPSKTPNANPSNTPNPTSTPNASNTPINTATIAATKTPGSNQTPNPTLAPTRTNTPSATIVPTTLPTSTPFPTLVPTNSTSSLIRTPVIRRMPNDIGTNIKSYGAKGDGVTDDTAAFKDFLDDGGGRLYLPAGTYIVHDTLDWQGCCMTFQGDGDALTTIKLKDNLPAFGNPNNPKPVIKTRDGNAAHANYVVGLTINTGRGNPGAIGLDYVSNNSGAVEHVTITSEDLSGVTGLYMGRPWPGPLLIKNLTVIGFNQGIETDHSEYGIVFENIYLLSQKVAGFVNNNNRIAIRNLVSFNKVNALVNNGGSATAILLDSKLLEGDSTTSGIKVNNGYLFARGVQTSGYSSSINDRGTTSNNSTVSYYTSNPQGVTLFGTNNKSLGLQVLDAPDYHDNNLNNWTTPNLIYNSYHDFDQLKLAFASGKSTIYFKEGSSLWGPDTIKVPAHIKKITCMDHAFNQWSTTGLTLRIEDYSPDPLIIERVNYGVTIENASNRTLVIRNSNIIYKDFSGAGDVFFEDVQVPIMELKHTKRLWARHLNTEGGDGPRIVNNSADLWILGLKTEGEGTVLSSNGVNARTEILGNLIYPAFGPIASGKPMLINNESTLSAILSWSVYVQNGMFPVLVKETRNGVTKNLQTSSFNGSALNYRGG
jgi:hypothetical protein